MKVTVVIQARTGSSRLPGKVLLPAAGEPLLARMLERVCAAQTASEVVVATTEAASDDAIVRIASRAGVTCIRGHATDCLDRHVQAARATAADAVVKIPSDCPLIDPATIDQVISAFLAEPDVDYVSNLHPPTWPDGCDVEVMTRGALETAWREAVRPLDREHTTPFLWDNPERFITLNVRWPTGRDFSRSHRLTLDYPEDYALIRAIYDQLWSPGRVFSLTDILDLLARRPELAQLNVMHRGTTWYAKHPGELRTIAHGGTP